MEGHDDKDQHSVAAQQAAAREYQPEYNAPMVGDLTPSSSLTQEYARADPIYVEKTITLPQQFSHYRPIRGDGNCGWRAIGYSYFEKLVETGNRSVIDGEIARLNEFNSNYLTSHGGFQYWDDFAEAFIDLLTDVANAMSLDLAAAYLLALDRWNDADLNNHLIYYLRMIAATHLKMNAATYDAFVSDSGGIANYCAANIEALHKEIEHVGVAALVDILLKPVNFALQVAYLDLSPGTAPNIYRFPEEANGQDESAFAGVIFTLFRPTHYDILYRHLPAVIQQQQSQYSVQVHRVAFDEAPANMTPAAAMHNFTADEFETLSMLPGFGNMPMGNAFSGPQQSSWMPFANPFAPAAPSPAALAKPQQPPAVMPVAVAAPPPPPPTTAAPPPPAAAAAIVPPPPPPPAVTAPPAESSPMSQPLPLVKIEPGLGPAPSDILRAISRASGPDCTIRFSPMQLQYDGYDPTGSNVNYPDPNFQVTTTTFKNSVWNRAHYGNPDFHPEEWSPDDDNAEGRAAGRKRSR
jgi:ubiquitin thioesterase protein OTUB1